MYSHRLGITILCSLEFLFAFSNGYKIMFISSPLAAKSHGIYIESISVDLVSRGHQVTHVSVGDHENVDGIEHIRMDPLPLDFNMFEVQLKHMFQLCELVQLLVDVSYSSHFMINLTHEPTDPKTGRAKYDVVVLDSGWTEHLLPLIHKMKVPFMFIAASYMRTTAAWNLNQPIPFSYFNYFGFPEPMSIMDRATNALASLGIVFYHNNFFIPNEQLAIQKQFPDSPPIIDIHSNASFVINNVCPGLQDSIPMMPFSAHIGCSHCRPARLLSEHLEAIMQSSAEAGVIYFSMGTFIKDEWIPTVFLNNLVKVLSELPQIVIWNCQANITIPPNFRQVSWVPQQDILGHPKLRLFINHAGLLSVQEASYHGCPVLVFPMCCDTYYAANMAEKKGFGQQLDWRTATASRMRDTIHVMLNDTRYKMAANRVSILMKDVLMSPTELAVYWIEYVCRHKELRLLDHSNKDVNLFQYLLLDVALVMAAGAILLVTLIWWTTKRLVLKVSNISERIINLLIKK